MNNYVSGKTIKLLREKRKITQRELAEKIGVTDKAVSKWETERGLPDICLLEPIAKELGVSITELISGSIFENKNKSSDMFKSKFYVCPVCGNILVSSGEAQISCCGVNLTALETQADFEDAKFVKAKRENGEIYVFAEHPMTKTHYLSFFAYVTGNNVFISKLYPEQSAEAYFPIYGAGIIYVYCNRDGLFSIKI